MPGSGWIGLARVCVCVRPRARSATPLALEASSLFLLPRARALVARLLLALLERVVLLLCLTKGGCAFLCDDGFVVVGAAGGERWGEREEEGRAGSPLGESLSLSLSLDFEKTRRRPRASRPNTQQTHHAAPLQVVVLGSPPVNHVQICCSSSSAVRCFVERHRDHRWQTKPASRLLLLPPHPQPSPPALPDKPHSPRARGARAAGGRPSRR